MFFKLAASEDVGQFTSFESANSAEKDICAKGERIRVVRIAHASLTPALRGRERGLAKCFPQLDIEVITPPRWHETGVDVETVPDEYFPVRTARTFFQNIYSFLHTIRFR